MYFKKLFLNGVEVPEGQIIYIDMAFRLAIEDSTNTMPVIDYLKKVDFNQLQGEPRQFALQSLKLLLGKLMISHDSNHVILVKSILNSLKEEPALQKHELMDIYVWVMQSSLDYPECKNKHALEEAVELFLLTSFTQPFQDERLYGKKVIDFLAETLRGSLNVNKESRDWMVLLRIMYLAVTKKFLYSSNENYQEMLEWDSYWNFMANYSKIVFSYPINQWEHTQNLITLREKIGVKLIDFVKTTPVFNSKTPEQQQGILKDLHDEIAPSLTNKSIVDRLMN